MSYKMQLTVDTNSSRVYENLSIWEKKLNIFLAKHDGFEPNHILLIEGYKKDECAKCDNVFDVCISHGTNIICCNCCSEFSFHGVLRPEPKGKTRREILEAIRKNGGDINEWL